MFYSLDNCITRELNWRQLQPPVRSVYYTLCFGNCCPLQPSAMFSVLCPAKKDMLHQKPQCVPDCVPPGWGPGPQARTGWYLLAASLEVLQGVWHGRRAHIPQSPVVGLTNGWATSSVQWAHLLSFPGGQWLGAIGAFPHAFYFVKKAGGPVILWATHVTRCVGVGAQHHLEITLLGPSPPKMVWCNLTLWAHTSTAGNTSCKPALKIPVGHPTPASFFLVRGSAILGFICPSLPCDSPSSTDSSEGT